MNQIINKSIPWSVIQSITMGAHYILNQMIVTANSRSNAEKGDPKVGGHSSASTSSLHILGALHLIVRNGQDWIANKPHTSPTDHAYHYLLNWFFDQYGNTLSSKHATQAMKSLRAFPNQESPYVFQSYHSHYDPDHDNFLPSGTVGIPPVCLAYLALAYEYLKDQGHQVPDAHFWALIGDSEFREGSLFEAIPDVAERELGRVTWMIDYNRQSLDGHRSTHPSIGTDDQRIEKTFLANGWDVIQVRHGNKRQSLFQKSQGHLFQELFEQKLDDMELQILLQISDTQKAREFILNKSPKLKSFLQSLKNEELMIAIRDLGGHDLPVLTQALEDSKKNSQKPCCLIIHTIKGWGLDMACKGDNHSDLPSQEEVLQLKQKTNLDKSDQDFVRFPKNSKEDIFLKQRRFKLLKEIEQQKNLCQSNIKEFQKNLSHLPTELNIPLKMMSYPHTQWMFGQWVSKLVRIASSKIEDLKESEKSFYKMAKMMVALSPDVGTSTNLSFSMNQKVYNSMKFKQTEDQWKIDNKKSPDLTPDITVDRRFFRFEIAEATAMSCLASFGQIKKVLGIPILPIMTVYDFFIKRALDQYFYSLYWESNFILTGTPSGVTLSSEGAQHGWKSDLQIPNQICFEPYFCKEVDWILTDAIYRHFTDNHQHRNGILLRAVTKGVNQKHFLQFLKMQARFKKTTNHQLLCLKNFPIQGAVDESTLETLPEEQIEKLIRKDVLCGAYSLIHYKSYKDYQPKENVVHIFAMGVLGTEAIKASLQLLKKGIYANVMIVTSPDLLLGSLAHQQEYRHLRYNLDLDISVPVVSVHDGEAGLLDNIGSILGVPQQTLAVRKHSMCGRPKDIYRYHKIDTDSIVKASLHAVQSNHVAKLAHSNT